MITEPETSAAKNPEIQSKIKSRISLRNKKISFRLTLLVGFMTILLCAFWGAGLYILDNSDKNLTHLFEKRMLPVERVSKMQKETVKVRMMLLRAMHHVREGNDIKPELEDIRAKIKGVNDLWTLSKNSSLTEEETILFSQYQEARQTLGQEGVFPLLAALQAGDADESLMVESVTGGAFESVEEAIDKIVASMQKSANEEIESSLERNTLIRKIAIALIVTGLLLVIILSVYIIRSVTQPLQRAMMLANRVAEGDLTDNIYSHSNDEIAHLLNSLGTMSTRLRNIVGEVHDGVNSIVVGSREISSGNTNLSQRTEEQASSLEQTASSMEEMASTVKQNANNAGEAKKLATANQQRAANGAEIVMRTVDAMSEINQSSNKIAEIITTINDIAFQTNLLALNAAVEAARAGEQGRGFAVVAGEVRTLAQRSAEAAKDIKNLIEDSVEKVRNGTRLADESGKTLEEIIEGTQKVADIITEIAAASNEQATGINQVNSAITQMDDMTQQNAALVEEAAAASRSMEDQANSLMHTVDFFKLEKNIGHSESISLQDRPVELASFNKQQQHNEPEGLHNNNSEAKRKTGSDKQGWENF